MIKVQNLKNKKEYIEEVATLEYEEWADDKENNKNRRINEKIKKIEKNLNSSNFCKLILLKENSLIGFISIFPNDSKECPNLTPWYYSYCKKKNIEKKDTQKY